MIISIVTKSGMKVSTTSACALLIVFVFSVIAEPIVTPDTQWVETAETTFDDAILDVKHHIGKRATPPQSSCIAKNKGRFFQDPSDNSTVWKCDGTKWVAFSISRLFVGNSCKDLKDIEHYNDCGPITSRAYGITIYDKGCNATVVEEHAKVFCEMEIDGGGWTLVWKHSVLQVGALSTSMYYHSKHSRPCEDIETGWCNIPNKYRFKPTEMLHIGYHNKKIVYAYKGNFNPSIDHDWTGAFLINTTKLVDQCTQGNGVPPMPKIYSGNPDLLGLDFAKRGSYQNIHEKYCDGYYVSLSAPGECRWWDCLLPSSLAAKTWGALQRTTAIYVR